MDGHAGYGAYGEDIVCAAVSSVAQAALLGLKDFLGNRVSFKKRAGHLSVDIEPEAAAGAEARAIVRTLELAVLAIFKEYPDRIKVMQG